MTSQLSNLATKEACSLLDQSMIKLDHCLRQLDEQQTWYRPHPALNSIGNLMLHMVGNLTQWALAGIGNQIDKREREKEFLDEVRVSQSELLNSAYSIVNESKRLFANLHEIDLQEHRTIQGFETTVFNAMFHTTTHFVGHTHQVIYLTRVQLGESYQFQWTPSSDGTQLPI